MGGRAGLGKHECADERLSVRGTGVPGAARDVARLSRPEEEATTSE
jgi:hypothetical protein